MNLYYFDLHEEKIEAVSEKQAYYFMYKTYGFNKKRVINLLATSDVNSSMYKSWVRNELTKRNGFVQLALNI